MFSHFSQLLLMKKEKKSEDEVKQFTKRESKYKYNESTFRLNLYSSKAFIFVQQRNTIRHMILKA